MAQYSVPDPEDLVECPYVKAHMVRYKRLIYHLMKCRKNYTGNQYGTCRFNARHEMPKPELRYHELQCSYKSMIEQDIYNDKTGDGLNFRGNTEVPTYYPDWDAPVSSEDWDRECLEYARVPRIGVDKRVEQRFHDTTGMSRAEKKKLNKKLKRQIQDIPDDDEKEATDELVPVTASGYAESNDSLETLSQHLGVDAEEHRHKEIRKLQKKLRQIKNLEMVQSEGKELNTDQQGKVDNKDELVAQINALRLEQL